MHDLTFLQDLAFVMAISAVIIIVCQRLHLPVVLGYIIAGVIMGPHTPPYSLVKDLHSINIMSELGIIFLLFSIGLEFSLTKLMKVGLVAVFAATVEILLMIFIGYYLGRAFGWKFMDSLFLGAILSISSTTIIAKVLMEMKIMKEEFSQVILGILIIEDLLAIVIIALLSGIASTGSLELGEIGFAMFRVSAFITLILLGGFLFVPRLLRYLERFDSMEMLIVTVLGLCFAVSLAAAKSGFSVALGSFLIGAIIAETKYAQDVIHKMEPIRDMFTAIFFVSVGMLIDPALLVKLWVPILLISLVTIIGKVVSCSFATFLTGYNSDTALKVGLGLAQIGEFSFIIARQGEGTNVTSSFLYPLAVSVSSITTLTTPLLIKNATPIVWFLERITPKPLATVLQLYTSWLKKIGGIRSHKRTVIFDGLKTAVPRLAFYALISAIFLYGLSYFQSRFHFLSSGAWWIVAGILVFPPFIGFVYALDRLLWNVIILNIIRSRSELDRDIEVNRNFHNAFRFFMVLGAGFLFITVGASFLPRIPLALAVAGLVLISGLFLWSSIRRVHERIERTVLSVFDNTEIGEKKNKRAAAHDELVKLIHKQYPWRVETLDFLLPFKESGVNQSIRDLNLRKLTGTTIVSIYRGDESIPNPAPETKLQPGDVLLLMGDMEQIQAAAALLKQKMKEPPTFD